MKKLLILLAGTFLLTGCSKNAEQIDVAKKKLADAGVKDADTYSFKVTELQDKYAYQKIAAHYLKVYDTDLLLNVEKAKTDLQESKNYIEKAKNPENKTFFQVNAYQLAATDTVHQAIVYLNDKNDVIGFEHLK
jgi:DNA repair protein RadC